MTHQCRKWPLMSRISPELCELRKALLGRRNPFGADMYIDCKDCAGAVPFGTTFDRVVKPVPVQSKPEPTPVPKKIEPVVVDEPVPNKILAPVPAAVVKKRRHRRRDGRPYEASCAGIKTTWHCRECGEDKSVNDFYFNQRKVCKPCYIKLKSARKRLKREARRNG